MGLVPSFFIENEGKSKITNQEIINTKFEARPAFVGRPAYAGRASDFYSVVSFVWLRQISRSEKN